MVRGVSRWDCAGLERSAMATGDCGQSGQQKDTGSFCDQWPSAPQASSPNSDRIPLGPQARPAPLLLTYDLTNTYSSAIPTNTAMPK